MKTSWSQRLVLALAVATAPALAQDASVFVSSFTWTTSTGEELAWSDPYQSLAASALSGGGLFGSDSDSYETESYLPAIGSASTSNALSTYAASGDQGFFLTAATTRGLYPIGTPRNESFATALNSGTFSLEQAGTVTFTVFYTLAVNKPGGNALSDFGASFLNFNAASADGTSGGDLSADLYSFAQLTGIGSTSGSFVLTVSLLANQLGFYTLDGRAESFAVAAIPEPETWALMLAGLAGVGAVVRRRKAVAA